MTTPINKSAHEVEHIGSGPLEDLEDRLAAARDEMTKAVEMRLDALETMIRHRPLLSIGIGVGVGYLIARLLKD